MQDVARPVPHLVIKVDYQFADREGDPDEESTIERGFFAAFTVFF